MADRERSDEYVFGGTAITGLLIGDPEPGVGYLQLGADFAVAEDFPVEVTPENPMLPICHLRITIENGKPVCSGLRLERRDGPIDGTTLRQIPLAPYIREALAHAAFRFTRDQDLAERAHEEHGGAVGRPREIDGEPAWVFREPDRSRWGDVFALRDIARSARRQPRRGIPISDGDLDEVAKIYKAALLAGEHPNLNVQEEMHLSRSTASRWIAKARERGFLGKARQGTATE